MGDDKIDQVLRTVDPAKRTTLKKLVIGAAFAVPIIASYSVKDLAYARWRAAGHRHLTIATVHTVDRLSPLSPSPRPRP